MTLNDNLEPDASLNKLIQKAQDTNLPYITYYDGLITKHDSAINCENALCLEHRNALIAKIKAANEIDVDTKLGTYLQLNPSLESPVYSNDVFEIERIHITHFRTGSHYLLIKTGRFIPDMSREMGICSCGNDVQSLRHVLMECSIVKNMEDSDLFVNSHFNVGEFFKWPKLRDYLLSISKALKFEL